MAVPAVIFFPDYKSMESKDIHCRPFERKRFQESLDALGAVISIFILSTGQDGYEGMGRLEELLPLKKDPGYWCPQLPKVPFGTFDEERKMLFLL